MTRWLAALLTLCLAAGSAHAQTAASPKPVLNLNASTGAANVLGFGAVLSATVDSSAAINAAAAAVGGVYHNVYLPTGSYHVTNALNISNGQCLVGDGRGLTTITVGADFSPTAAGVINMSGNEQLGPCVRDLSIVFAQPFDQTSRAAFTTLTAHCTTGTGGTGCKYPPAINFGTSNRFRVQNVSVYGAWDGFTGTATAGFLLDNIEMGALDVGLTLGGGFDFGHISHWHSWPFGIGASLYSSVYSDGSTIAAIIGEVDGLNVVDFASFIGRVQLTSAFSWGQFANIEMDGNSATFEVAGGNTAMGVSIANMYSTGEDRGSNAHCQLDVTVGNVSVTNLRSFGGLTPGVCISSGQLNIVGGYQFSNYLAGNSIVQTGGILSVSGVQFSPGNFGPRTQPIVKSTGAGIISFTGNSFIIGTPGDVGALSIGTDSNYNIVSGNSFAGWGFTPPTGLLGLYGPNAGGSTSTTYTPVISGWPSGVVTAATATGSYTRQGPGAQTCVRIAAAVTTVGSAAGFAVSLPVAPTASGALAALGNNPFVLQLVSGQLAGFFLAPAGGPMTPATGTYTINGCYL
jgi:hypothetical protein